MKTKPVILMAAISAFLITGASAQQDAPPAGGTPPPPKAQPGADAPKPPGEGDAPRPPGGPREGDAPRPPGGPREGGGRGPGGPRDGAQRDGAPRDGAQRDGANRGPRDGANNGGPGGLRDGNRPQGGPRDGAPNPGPAGPRDGSPGGPGGPRDGAGRGPEGFHPGGPRGEHAEEANLPKEKRAFLGVMVTPLPGVLSAQLGFAEGFGLVVHEVAPDSPAAKAGVQKYDVIKLLNDQQIVDQAQLATLVTGLGSGKEATLTVVRKAQEQKITVTLGEHMVTVRGPEGPGHGMFGSPGQGFGGLPNELQERLRNAPDKAREMREHMQEFQRRMHEGPGPRDGAPKPGASIDPERLLQEAQPGGGAPIRVETTASSTTIDGAQAHLRLKDNTGEIEVASTDGKRVLTARDPEGKVVFTGPVSTEEERAAVPEEIRKKLEQIHIRQNGGNVGVTVATSTGSVAIAEEDFQ